VKVYFENLYRFSNDVCIYLKVSVLSREESVLDFQSLYNNCDDLAINECYCLVNEKMSNTNR